MFGMIGASSAADERRSCLGGVAYLPWLPTLEPTPQHEVGFIIGRGGSKIQSIRDQTGAAVRIHDSVDGQERIVEFTGTAEQVPV